MVGWPTLEQGKSQVCFAHDRNCWAISLFFISTNKTFVIFSLPYPAKKGSDRVALVGTWHPTLCTQEISLTATVFTIESMIWEQKRQKKNKKSFVNIPL